MVVHLFNDSSITVFSAEQSAEQDETVIWFASSHRCPTVRMEASKCRSAQEGPQSPTDKSDSPNPHDKLRAFGSL